MFYFANIFPRAFVPQREDGENHGDVAEAARGALRADEIRNFANL